MKKDKAISGLLKIIDRPFVRINMSLKTIIPPNTLPYIISAIIIFTVLFTLMLMEAGLIGRVIGPEGVEYSDEINQKFSGAQEYIWYPQNQGAINSISLDGLILGNGSVRISLIAGNESYLVLDSTLLEQQGMGAITGFAAGTPTESEIDNIALEQMSEDEEEDIRREIEEQTEEQEKAEEMEEEMEEEGEEEGEEAEEINAVALPEDSEVSIKFEYAKDSEFDKDNDGIEMYDGVIDFSVDKTGFNWDVDESHLCARWIITNDDENSSIDVCYGSALCCDFIEADLFGERWDAEYYAFKGKDNAGANNTISVQVIYVDYNLSAENLYSYIYYSSRAEKQAVFLPGAALMINFTGACIDTCILPSLNETSYKFVIETDPGTVFALHNITYYLDQEPEIADENITIQFSKIYESEDTVKDTYIRYRYPDSNYGDDNLIKVGNENAWNRNRRGLIYFNISDIPQNAEITSAELKIYKNTGVKTGNITLHRLTREWIENKATWNEFDEGRQWNNPGGDYDSRIYASVPTGKKWMSLDITGLAQEWVDGRYANQGVILIRDPEDAPNTFGYFRSSEDNVISYRPKLIVNYTIINYTGYPTIDIISPIENYTYVSGSNATIKLNVTDIYGIDSVLASIIWPGYSESIDLEQIDNTTIFQALFTNTSYIGNYTIHIIANNSYGMINDAVFRVFSVCSNCSLEQQINIIIFNSSTGSNFTVNITILEDGSVEMDMPDNPVEVKYTTIIPFDPPVVKVVFYGLDINATSISELEIGIDYPLEYPESPFLTLAQIYALDFSKVPHDYAEVFVRARGQSLYKCLTWNFTTRQCTVEGENWGSFTPGIKQEKAGNGTAGWIKLMDIPQDQEIYKFRLDPGDPGFIEDGAIYCLSSPCIATSAMIRSVDRAGGIVEFNQPNTIDNCRDGNKGTYLVDESVENITVTDQNNSVFLTGDIVEINATVHCFGDGSSDNITFVYSNNTEDTPGSWRVIDKVTPCPGPGMQDISTNLTLDNRSGNHSVRVIIRYDDSADVTCGTGKYDDNDDISFIVSDMEEIMPYSTSPPDQDADIGDETIIEWTLQDNFGAGYYYVERNGEMFENPSPWFNNTRIIIRPNNYFLGSWNYTIYYNNSLGIYGTPDTVFVNVSDKTIPLCNDLADNNGYPILKNITIDGNMQDWEAVKSNSRNYVSDLTAAGGDADTGMTADRDLIGFAYTWDNEYLYLYYKRLNTGKNRINLLAYLDYGNDGYMNATDHVLRFVWSGSNQKYDSYLYNYIPAAAADEIKGSGYDLPGSLTLNASLQNQIIGGAESGIEMEASIQWNNLGLSGPVPLNFKASCSLGINLPAQLEDNMDSISSIYARLLFQPDHTKAAANGTSVYYDHDLMNCGILEETIDFESISSLGWNITLYYPNGKLINDSNGNNNPDTTLGVENYTTIIAKIDVPGAILSGTIDTTNITALSSVEESVNKTVTDTTIAGEIIITPNLRVISGAENMLAALNYTVYNLQKFSDIIEIRAESSHGWNISLYYLNGSSIHDTDGDSHPDVGRLLPGESKDIVLVFTIPENSTDLSKDIITIQINSSFNPNLTANATSDTTVKKRITIELDYNRTVGIGDYSYYELTISNNWNESDVIDVSHIPVLGWDTVFYDSDKMTLLTDSDSDGIIDIGSIGYYGSQHIIYARITVPAAASEGDSELTVIHVNSSKDTSVYDVSLINTTSRVVITYNDFARMTEQSIFEAGDTIYARVHNIDIKKVYYLWIDPNSSVIKVSPDIIVSAENNADDLLAANSSMLLGNWTLIVFNAQNDNEIGRNIFELVDTAPPSAVLNYPPAGHINDSAIPANIRFNCSAADNYGLANLSLYITDSLNQSFSLHSTADVSGKSNSSVWDISLQEGAYTWNCIAYDSAGNSGWGDDNRTIIIKAIGISKVILYAPLNDSSDPETMPEFIWYNAASADNSVITYDLQIDDTYGFFSDPEVNITGIAEGNNLTNYTLTSDLAPDMQYYWRVRAFNGTDYGVWSETWEYYVEGVVAFSFIFSDISFGLMELGEQNDTTDNLPMPFIIQNDGNVFIDLRINASSQLWMQQPLNTSYFQFMVDDRHETESFNISGSRTTWDNISMENKHAIRQLDYNDYKDTAVIDILMKVPYDEPAGTRSANINLIAEKST